MYIYIYIYRERERVRYLFIYIYIYISGCYQRCQTGITNSTEIYHNYKINKYANDMTKSTDRDKINKH